jgi:hypothetical protein
MIGSLIGGPLKLPQGDGIESHHRDDRKTKHDEREIEHERLLARRFGTAGRCKFSIAIRPGRHKDFVRPIRWSMGTISEIAERIGQE